MGVLQDLEKLILPVERLNLDGIPSASLAILEDGKISAHVITKDRENEDTAYQACSISKPITALAVARLVDQGRISYETKIVDHLNQSTIDCIVEPKTTHLMQHVTINILLSHTSGLSQHGFYGYAGNLPSAEDVLAGRHPSNTPKARFYFFPGAQFIYSGAGYILLQLLLESVMDMPFPDLMKHLVLDPLGMTRSWYGDLPPDEMNFAHAHYTAYKEADPSYNYFVELAAAGVWTTPTDLLRGVSVVQDSLYTDSGFLKQATAKKMLTQVSEVLPDSGMALGWGVTDSFFAHGGSSLLGFETYFLGFHGGVVNSSQTENGHRPEKRRCNDDQIHSWK